MTTKPPSPVAEAAAESLEKKVYALVADVETLEPNDRNRLAYRIWVWVTDRKGTLREAVLHSGSRTTLPLAEVADLVERRVKEKGIA